MLLLSGKFYLIKTGTHLDREVWGATPSKHIEYATLEEEKKKRKKDWFLTETRFFLVASTQLYVRACVRACVRVHMSVCLSVCLSVCASAHKCYLNTFFS